MLPTKSTSVSLLTSTTIWHFSFTHRPRLRPPLLLFVINEWIMTGFFLDGERNIQTHTHTTTCIFNFSVARNDSQRNVNIEINHNFIFRLCCKWSTVAANECTSVMSKLRGICITWAAVVPFNALPIWTWRRNSLWTFSECSQKHRSEH